MSDLPYNYDHTAVRAHIWHLRFVLPKTQENERKWSINMNLAVAGETMEQAIATARAVYPDAVFYGASHGSFLLVESLPQTPPPKV